MIRTFCKDCLLAEYTDGKQTGCKIGRLDKFKSKEFQDPAYIIHQLCNTCRSTVYRTRYPNPEKDIRAEVRVKVDIFILLDKVYQENLRDICNVYNKLKPNCVKLIIKEEVDPWPIQEAFRTFARFPFNVVKIFDNYSISEMIDYTIKYCTGEYYSVIDQYYEPFDFITQLDTIVNDDLKRVIAFRPIDSTLITIHKKTHEALYGSFGEHILTKIEQITKEQNKEDWIREWVV